MAERAPIFQAVDKCSQIADPLTVVDFSGCLRTLTKYFATNFMKFPRF